MSFGASKKILKFNSKIPFLSGLLEISIFVSYLPRFCAASRNDSADGISKDKSFICINFKVFNLK